MWRHRHYVVTQFLGDTSYQLAEKVDVLLHQLPFFRNSTSFKWWPVLIMCLSWHEYRYLYRKTDISCVYVMCWFVCWRETSMTVNGLYVCLQRLFESNNNDITKKLSDVWSLYLHAYELVKMDYKTDLVVSYCITGWNKLSKHQTTLNRINSGNCSCWPLVHKHQYQICLHTIVSS